MAVALIPDAHQFEEVDVDAAALQELIYAHADKQRIRAMLKNMYKEKIISLFVLLAVTTIGNKFTWFALRLMVALPFRRSRRMF